MVEARAAKEIATKLSAAKVNKPLTNLDDLPTELLYSVQDLVHNVHLDQVAPRLRSIFGAEENLRKLCTYCFQQIPYPITVAVMMDTHLQDEHREAVLKLINRDWFLREFNRPMDNQREQYFISEKYMRGWMLTEVGLRTWLAPDKWTQKQGDFICLLAKRFPETFQKVFYQNQPFVANIRTKALMTAMEQGCAPAIALLACFRWTKLSDDQDPGLGDFTEMVDQYTGKRYVPKNRWSNSLEHPWNNRMKDPWEINQVDHGAILNAALANGESFPELMNAVIVLTLKRLFCVFRSGALVAALKLINIRKVCEKLKGRVHPRLQRLKGVIQKLMTKVVSMDDYDWPPGVPPYKPLMQDTSLEKFEAQILASPP